MHFNHTAAPLAPVQVCVTSNLKLIRSFLLSLTFQNALSEHHLGKKKKTINVPTFIQKEEKRKKKLNQEALSQQFGLHSSLSSSQRKCKRNSLLTLAAVLANASWWLQHCPRWLNCAISPSSFLNCLHSPHDRRLSRPFSGS